MLEIKVLHTPDWSCFSSYAMACFSVPLPRGATCNRDADSPRETESGLGWEAETFNDRR